MSGFPIWNILNPFVLEFLALARQGITLRLPADGMVWEAQHGNFSLAAWPEDDAAVSSLALHIYFQLGDAEGDERGDIACIYCEGQLSLRFGNESDTEVLCSQLPLLAAALEQLLQQALPLMEADLEEFTIRLPPETGVPPATDTDPNSA